MSDSINNENQQEDTLTRLLTNLAGEYRAVAEAGEEIGQKINCISDARLETEFNFDGLRFKIEVTEQQQ